jgi:transposase
MLTTATHNEHGTTSERVLLMAFELSEHTWTLGFTTGPGHKPREQGVAARNQARVRPEVAQANTRVGLSASAPLVSCDEAGRAGFWLPRFLQAQGITNQVVDSSRREHPGTGPHHVGHPARALDDDGVGLGLAA